jgi:hypothetical protein
MLTPYRIAAQLMPCGYGTPTAFELFQMAVVARRARDRDETVELAFLDVHRDSALPSPERRASIPQKNSNRLAAVLA